MNIREDNTNIYLDDFIIPKGMEKSDLKAREQVIWDMYSRWASVNTEKKCYNKHLESDIYVVFKSITETSEKAARNYKSTMAFYALEFALQQSQKIGQDKPHSKRQTEFTTMLIMESNTNVFAPYFNKIKLTVGIKRSGRKNMYCLTAIEETK